MEVGVWGLGRWDLGLEFWGWGLGFSGWPWGFGNQLGASPKLLKPSMPNPELQAEYPASLGLSGLVSAENTCRQRRRQMPEVPDGCWCRPRCSPWGAPCNLQSSSRPTLCLLPCRIALQMTDGSLTGGVRLLPLLPRITRGCELPPPSGNAPALIQSFPNNLTINLTIKIPVSPPQKIPVSPPFAKG